MRRWVAIPAVLAAGPALADWTAMTGAENAAALTGRVLVHQAARQEFLASGGTLYDAGRPSWGRWEVRGDAYCSQWPPAEDRASYAMEREDGTGALRFVGESGEATEGRYAE